MKDIKLKNEEKNINEKMISFPLFKKMINNIKLFVDFENKKNLINSSNVKKSKRFRKKVRKTFKAIC